MANATAGRTSRTNGLDEPADFSPPTAGTASQSQFRPVVVPTASARAGDHLSELAILKTGCGKHDRGCDAAHSPDDVHVFVPFLPRPSPGLADRVARGLMVTADIVRCDSVQFRRSYRGLHPVGTLGCVPSAACRSLCRPVFARPIGAAADADPPRSARAGQGLLASSSPPWGTLIGGYLAEILSPQRVPRDAATFLAVILLLCATASPARGRSPAE